MIGTATALLISGIVSALAGAGVSAYSASQQKKATEESNATNIELAKMANEAQMQQVRETNEFNAAEAQKARDWETEMSNTQMQRAMADYQAAGVNPLLALPSGATNNAPASATGNVANIKAAHVQPAALDLSGVASAASSLSNLMLLSSLMNNKDPRARFDANFKKEMKMLHGKDWKSFYKNGGFESI